MLFVLLPAMIASPFVNGYLRRHHVGTALTRALTVGLVAAVLTLLAMALAHLAKRRPLALGRLRFAPIVAAIFMALASVVSDWIWP